MPEGEEPNAKDGEIVIPIKITKGDDFRSIYANGAHFVKGADDVKLVFYTVHPIRKWGEQTIKEGDLIRYIEEPGTEIIIHDEVIMPFTFFERLTQMLNRQMAAINQEMERQLKEAERINKELKTKLEGTEEGKE